jgi:predicted  nucleic acid-binding Zn-ribbon protein
MTYVYRKYENPETKQMVDLQELINDLFEILKSSNKEMEEAQTHIVMLKDKVQELHTRLSDREDEINSLSLRLLRTEEDDIELRNDLHNNYNKIERVSIELDNHSH